jgi:signal transduction histidine kinase/ActR/RegA family two-component response regulator
MAAAFSAFIEGRAEYDTEYRLLAPTGRLHWVHERAYAAARDDQGRITLVAGLTIDVTERHRIEQGLRDADRQKDAFLAMLAHELRNPLAPIRTATDVLGLPGIDETTRAHVRDIIERQVVHITRLVDDLLDVSRLSRGRLQLQRGRVDLGAVVRETVADYARFLSAARLTVTVDVPDEPVEVEGDATRLAQVLGNLLHNVRKFTPAGGRVHVALRTTPEGEALLAVEDSGEGVSADLMPHIFEPFSQGAQSLDRSHGGLGLGLSLVKGLVELHGGSVAVSSEGPGCGTRFDICLPLGAQAPSSGVSAWPAPASSSGLAILVIEDNADAAETMRLLLASEGHQVTVAHSADAGIESARRGRPDLVLCDIGLPGPLNGLDVARTLRTEGIGARLVAVTGYAGPEHVRAAEEAGFHLHLTKPVGVAAIRQIVASASRLQNAAAGHDVRS